MVVVFVETFGSFVKRGYAILLNSKTDAAAAVSYSSRVHRYVSKQLDNKKKMRAVNDVDDDDGATAAARLLSDAGAMPAFPQLQSSKVKAASEAWVPALSNFGIQVLSLHFFLFLSFSFLNVSTVQLVVRGHGA